MSPAGTCRAAASRSARPFREALRRELIEEGRIELRGEPVLHGVFLNSHVSPRDHVAVYLVRHFRPGSAAQAEPRDHRVRLLRAKRAAGGNDRGDPAADRRGDRGQGADGDLALKTMWRYGV